MLVWARHSGSVFGDDFFFQLVDEVAPLHASLILLFLMACGFPLSWKKVQLTYKPVWIGWRIHLDLYAVEMVEDKRLRLVRFLEQLPSTAA